VVAGETTKHEGTLPSGSRFLILVPDKWNGILLLAQRPLPVGPGDPPWGDDEPLLAAMLDLGYALGGSANTVFWPLERCFADQAPLLDAFDRLVGPPRHTIAWGPSIGGIMTAGLVQLIPDRLSGALPLCGNLSGGVAVHNRELDIAFVTNVLLAPDPPLELVHITDPGKNLRSAESLLQDAQGTSVGRARLALAAAIGNIPGWYDPASPEPPEDDDVARQRAQFQWFEEVGFLVYFFLRAQVERHSGGNPSWNIDVDYRSLLSGSIGAREVEALYELADLDLDADLARLEIAPRIAADAAAVGYLERHIAFSGDLSGVPVLTMHTVGDGLVAPCNERAYAEVVAWADRSELLRQLWISRGGHCSFTQAEILTGLQALVDRLERRTWPALDPETLNAAASAFGPEHHITRDGSKAESHFAQFEPPPFSRPHDVRSMGKDHP